MKMNFKYVSMMACAALMAGFTSCSNDGDADVPTTAKGATTMQIKLDLPSTRASQEYAGTAEEQAINEVSVWIFDAAGGATTVRHMAPNQGDDTVIEIPTTAGEKVVFVGANLPSVVKGNVTSAGKDLIATYVHNIAMGDLAGDNGIAMFAQAPASITLIESAEADPTPAQNKLSVKVERMVAKVVAGQKVGGAEFATLPAGEGAFDTTFSLEYTVKHLNRYIFTTKQATDPNYGGFEYTWDGSASIPNPAGTYGLEQFENSKNYVAVGIPADATGTAWDAVNCFYVPENMEEVGRYGSNTYVAIKAKFNAPTKAADGSFWTLNDATTLDIISFHDVEPTPAAGQVASGKYEQGYCYYRVYPIKETGYNVHRNDYYRLRINKISALGSYTDEEPDIFLPPGEPIDKTNAKIDVTVEVMQWILFDEEEHNLGE